MRRIIGYTIGEATPTQVTFISKEVPAVGQYVILEYGGRRVLGMIQSLVRGSVSITDDIYDAAAVERIRAFENGETHYIKGIVKILGDIESLRIPRTPPPPATEIYEADIETLKRIFGNDHGTGIRIGVLISQPKVPVYVDVNKMVSRHLAILAITGAGKSNTVAIIADGIARLGGAVLIFDMHSEYSTAKFRSGKANVIRAKINPVNLSTSELLKLLNIDQSSFKQERYFRKALKEAKKRLMSGSIHPDQLLEIIQRELEKYSEEDRYKSDRSSIMSVINKIEGFLDRYEHMIDYYAPDIVDQLKLGYVNVVDLGQVDEEAADVIVSHALSSLLLSRKRYIVSGDGLSFPIFVVLEEAHILAPKDRGTLSKYWISRVAREGRKFGIGLCLVSQRPKALDPNTLSQMNNMIVLRLVEPSDKRYFQEASETLSEDLVEQLPSLNVGEAVVLGMMVKIPALVKIDKFEGKLVGGDLDVVSAWRKCSSTLAKRVIVKAKELDDMLELW